MHPLDPDSSVINILPHLFYHCWALKHTHSLMLCVGIYVFVCVCIHKYEGQTLGDGEGQGGMVCCCPWGCKESDMTERLNNTIQYTYTHTHNFPLNHERKLLNIYTMAPYHTPYP